MVDMVKVSAPLSAATSSGSLIDAIWDQVDRLLESRPASVVPKGHRQKIEQEGDMIVFKKSDVTVCQRITDEDIKNLPAVTLRHAKMLEQSMDNHNSVWAAVYPQPALTVDSIAMAQIKQRLKSIVVNMKSDLDGLLQFLLDYGLHLDDHFMRIRSVARSL